ITATHTDNQTDWNRYSSKDPNISATNTVQLSNSAQTANIDFNTEAEYIQEDADSGTDFTSGQVKLHSVPGYTVDLCTDGAKAYADEAYATNTGDKAFDNIIGKHNAGTSWYRYQTPFPGYLGYDFGVGNEKVIIKYTLANVTDRYATMFPRDWTFEGSNDSTNGLTDGTWTVLDTRSGESAALAEIKSYEFSNSSAYRWYRWNITESNYGAVSNLQISEAEMIGLANTYSINNPKYITTSDTSHFNLSGIANINSAIVTKTEPTNTSIKGLVSFDGRATWQKWSGSAWLVQSGGLDDLQNGNSVAEIQTGLTNFTVPEGVTSVDFAFDLTTTDPAITPSIDNIAINYSTASQGTLTSSIFDTTVSGASLASLQWSESLPSNTDIQFQLHTSSDGTNWGPWCGPENGT
ncbi:MAG: hypothetical protein Q8M12_04425, partial [bacterium]|nr:hypothetical protein [bacterium]